MLLVGDSHLVVSQDLRFADFLPLRHPDEMLCLDARGAQEVRMRDHGDEIRGGHIFPELIDKGPIVDLWTSALVAQMDNGRQTRREGAMHRSSRSQSFPS